MHRDLLTGSATGIPPSLLLGSLWSQTLPAQSSTSAPGIGGWSLGSKYQTAKIPLLQGKAREYDVGCA